MSQLKDRSSVNTPTILVMVSNLSQKLSSLLKSSLLARLLLMLLPLLLAPKPELDSEDSQLDSILVQSFYPTTVLLPSDLTEEEV